MNVGAADDPREPGPKGNDRKPGQDLVRVKHHHGDGKQGCKRRADDHPHEQPEPRIAGLEAHDDGNHGAACHQPLGAQIDHPGALADDQAQAGQQERRGEVGRGRDPVEQEVRGHGEAGLMLRLISNVQKKREMSRQNRMVPSTRITTASEIE